MKKNDSGLLIVYTGNGKGKTTAAFGLALRAAGQGLKTLILQFMKGQNNIGEIKAIGNCQIPIDIVRFGRSGFVQSRACEPLDIYLAEQGLKYFQDVLTRSEYKVIVLDEILVAIHFGLLKEKPIHQIPNNKPFGVHIVLTGRNASKEMVEMADLVTNMKDEKHPFKVGFKAQAGIEF